MRTPTAIKLIVLLSCWPLLLGCMLNPVHQPSKTRLGSWQTYEFDGEFTCQLEGRTNHGTESNVHYINAGELGDQTKWFALQLSGVVPVEYKPREGPSRFYNSACVLVIVSQPTPNEIGQENHRTEVWFEIGQRMSMTMGGSNRQDLEANLDRIGFRKLAEPVEFRHEGLQRLFLVLDNEAAIENLWLSIDATITTRLHSGRITTTYNIKRIPSHNYHPWLSRSWP